LDIADKQELYPVQNSYNFLLGVVIQALAMQDITAVSAGKSDLSIKMPNGSLRKISGNAQFRKKDMIVQHGTLILDESLFQEIEKYQLHPPEEPEYRARRTHRDFLAAIESPLDENQFGLDLLNLLSQSKLADLPQEKNSSLTSKNTPNTRQFAFLKESLRLRKTLMLQKYSDNNWLWKTEL
jgi:lipoate-protein ligase A